MADDIVTRLHECAMYDELLSDDLAICRDAAEEIDQLRAAGDALADNLRRHVMACGVHDARQALAAWEEARRG